MTYMDAKSEKILNYIAVSQECVSVEMLEKTFKLSRRSVYYEICKINEWLVSCNLPELQKIRGKGYYIENKTKQQLENFKNKTSNRNIYIFSPMERAYIIICYVIYSGNPVYIQDLMECCNVSRNTVFNDLKIVSAILKEYDTALEYKPKEGYFIEGDEITIRALFLYFFNTITPLVKNGLLPFISAESIWGYYGRLKKLEADLNVIYTEGILFSLSALFPIMLRNKENLTFPDIKLEELLNIREYQLTEEYFPELAESERIYLCLHLLGSRVSAASEEIFKNRLDPAIYEMVKACVAEFEKAACVIFENREELERALFVHVSASRYRYEYGIQVGNPILDDVKREYPELFDITKIVCGYIENQMGVPVSDGEVAYLALHFGAHLQVNARTDLKLRILIVCSAGISTGNMIKHELCRMLPDVKIVGVAAAETISLELLNTCDLIVSTIKLNCLIPVIMVHPVLDALDKRNILNHPLVRRRCNTNDIDGLFDTLKKYISKEDFKNVKKEITAFFIGKNEELCKGPFEKPEGMLRFLDVSLIHVIPEQISCTWEQAVKMSGKELINRGNVAPQYLDNIILRLRHYGPYMFITEGVVLAHAKPEEGVYRIGISLNIFKKAVVFTDSYKAHIIIILAPEDQEKHLKILRDIINIFLVRERTERLTQADSPEECCELLKEWLQE